MRRKHFDVIRNVGMNRRVEQLSALGQEDRLAIFRLLVRAGPQGRCVDEIKRRLRVPGSTLSHHLEALTRAGLLGARRSGRFIFYAVNWREATALIRFLAEDCCAEMQIGPGAPESGRRAASEPCDVLCVPARARIKAGGEKPWTNKNRSRNK